MYVYPACYNYNHEEFWTVLVPTAICDEDSLEAKRKL